jgi:LmbE family N-acetylglucosaminyl deacetylase
MKEDKLTLLAVLAHPDDESFGMGGTLALYARRGVDVHLVCATQGEVGEMDPEFMEGYSTIAERRQAELCCAAEKLGLAGVHFLGYRDSGMAGSVNNHHPEALAAAPIEEVAGKVAHFIRQLCPQVVVTFDPIGGYRHPDHIAVHNATVRAFELAGDPLFLDELPPHKPQKLYFYTMSRRFLRLAVRLMPVFGKDPHHFGRNGDIDLAGLVAEDFPMHAFIDYTSVKELKAEASICHASQGGSGMIRGMMGWIVRLAGARETFMRAYPPPEPHLRERDLFAGIRAGESPAFPG